MITRSARSVARGMITPLAIGVLVLGLGLCLLHPVGHDGAEPGISHGLCVGLVVITAIPIASIGSPPRGRLFREVAAARLPAIFPGVPDPPPWSLPRLLG